MVKKVYWVHSLTNLWFVGPRTIGSRANEPSILFRAFWVHWKVSFCSKKTERQVVGRRGRVARPQPVVGNHPDVQHKGQYRVVGVAAGALWIVALCRTPLLPLAHRHRGVEVKRVVVALCLYL